MKLGGSQTSVPFCLPLFLLSSLPSFSYSVSSYISFIRFQLEASTYILSFEGYEAESDFSVLNVHEFYFLQIFFFYLLPSSSSLNSFAFLTLCKEEVAELEKPWPRWNN